MQPVRFVALLLAALLLFAPFPSPAHSQSICPGVRNLDVCCPSSCRICGGPGCHLRSGGQSCCTSKTSRSRTFCRNSPPPCRLDAPTSAPRWTTLSATSGSPTPRHEACFVMVGGKGYLMGGRRRDSIDVYDPIADSWSRRNGPGLELHHMQCVAVDRSVWIVSSWTGNFPRETNVPNIYIYNTIANRWSTRPGLQESRLRGGAAAVLHNRKIFVVGGNRGGHGRGSLSLPWMDYYDLDKNEWVSNLPDLPDARDHVGGAIVNGNKLCIAGGRDGRRGFLATRAATFCFTFETRRWRNMNADIPTQRAGAAYATTCARYMMIAGGERADAVANVELFDGHRWREAPSLQRKRHGTGLASARCPCGQIFIASGSGSQGGSPELSSSEVFLPNGINRRCASY